MARGFGNTHGVDGADRITRPVTTGLPSRITILCRARRFSTTGYPRIFGLSSGAADLFWYNNNTCWGDVFGNKYAAFPNIPLGEWSSIGVSDESATPGDILAVINGGVHLVGSGISLTGGGGYSTATGTQVIGNRASDNIRVWNGHIADFALYNDRLTVGEHMEFQRGVSPLKIRPQNLLHYLPIDSDPRIDLAGAHSLWTPTGMRYRDGQVFPHVEPRRQSVFLPSWMSGGGPPPELLVIQDMLHNTILSSPELTAHHVIGVDNLLHGSLLSSPELTAHNVAVVSDLQHGTVLENIDLSQAVTISADNLLHGSLLSSPELTAHNVAVVSDMLHGTVLENIDLSQAVTISADNLLHGSLLSSPELTAHNVAIVSDMLHETILSSPELTAHHIAVVSDMMHGSLLEGVELSSGSGLTVSSLEHQTILASPELTAHHAIAISNMLHAHEMDDVNLVLPGQLIVSALAHATGLDSADLQIGVVTLSIAELAHVTSVDGIELSTVLSFAIGDMAHALLNEGLALTQHITLTVADLTHATSLQQSNVRIPPVVVAVPGFYGEMQLVALEMLGEFQQGDVVYHAPGDVTGPQWAQVAGPATPYPLLATALGVSERYIDGKSVFATDVEITAAVFGEIPSISGTIEIDGKVLQIVRTWQIPAAGTPVVWKIIARG